MNDENLKQFVTNRRQRIIAEMGHVYARLRDLVCGKRADGLELTMTMPAQDWWTIVIALERAAESFREDRPVNAACDHVWERRGDPCRADGYWYECSKCGRFSR
jgi:hypothetical protein